MMLSARLVLATRLDLCECPRVALPALPLSSQLSQVLQPCPDLSGGVRGSLSGHCPQVAYQPTYQLLLVRFASGFDYLEPHKDCLL